MNASLCQTTLNTRWIFVNGEKTHTIRSDKLDKCTSEDFSKLKELGIKAIIDLREHPENKRSPLIEESGLKYFNFPTTDDVPDDFYDSIGIKQDINSRRLAKSDFYVHSLKNNIKSFEKILQKWIELDGHVLIHCSLGRDRTGIVSAIIQKAMGASDNEIIESYALSANNLSSLNLEGERFIDYKMSKIIIKDFLKKVQEVLKHFLNFIKTEIYKKITNILLPKKILLKRDDYLMIVGERPYDNQSCIVLPYQTGFYATKNIPEVAFLSNSETQSMILILGILLNSIDHACQLIIKMKKLNIPMSILAEYLYNQCHVILINRYDRTINNGRKNRDKLLITIINEFNKYEINILTVGKLKTKKYKSTTNGKDLEIVHCSPKNANTFSYFNAYFYRKGTNGVLSINNFCILK